MTKWLPYMEKLSSASSFCLFGKGAKILLAQIILGSDYIGKNYSDSFCQFREKLKSR